MSNRPFKIAVVSDLHCHPEMRNSSENNTILFSAKLRSPINEHPVEDLLEIIEKDNLEVDLLLSPGDITHQCDQQGFFSGWSYVKEISSALKSTDTIATIGNHDVDSRHTHSQYSLDIPKKVKQSFPISKNDIGTFWDQGFTFIEKQEAQILVLNSTHFHTHYNKDKPVENPVVRGKVEAAQIEEIRRYLDSHKTEKIKIFLCHHHPVNHSRLSLGEHDFIENGEDLLNVLGEFRFDLVIHGHKHDPWLRYVNTYCGYQLPVLSSGSFSATNQILWAGKFNYFHIVELIKRGEAPALGAIVTYTFKNKSGWRKDKEDGFWPYTGFGYLDGLSQIIDKIEATLKDRQVVPWADILAVAPEIKFLIPDKMLELERLLEAKRINISSKIGIGPKHIYYEGD